MRIYLFYIYIPIYYIHNDINVQYMHIHTAQTWIEREGLMVYVQTPHLQVRKSQVLLFIPSHQKRCSVRWKHTVKSSRWRWTSKK